MGDSCVTDVPEEDRIFPSLFENRMDKTRSCTLSLRSRDTNDESALVNGVEEDLRGVCERTESIKLLTWRNARCLDDAVKPFEVIEVVGTIFHVAKL